MLTCTEFLCFWNNFVSSDIIKTSYFQLLPLIWITLNDQVFIFLSSFSEQYIKYRAYRGKRTYTDRPLNYDGVDRGQWDWPTWPVGLEITSLQQLKWPSVLAALPTIHFTVKQHMAATHLVYLLTSQASLCHVLSVSPSVAHNLRDTSSTDNGA